MNGIDPVAVFHIGPAVFLKMGRLLELLLLHLYLERLPVRCALDHLPGQRPQCAAHAEHTPRSHDTIQEVAGGRVEDDIRDVADLLPLGGRHRPAQDILQFIERKGDVW